MSDAVTAASADASAKDAISKEPEVAQDEDYSKTFAPVVHLVKVETKTGEEDEDVLFKVRAKLFRFSKELKEWKERGTGEVRILKHKENKKIRLLMRREKTLKICMNQFVNPSVELKDNVGSDRSWVWQAIDYADEEKDEAMLAIRFRDSDNANQFKDAYNKAREHMKELANKDDAKAENKEEPDDSNEKGSAEATADESGKVDEK